MSMRARALPVRAARRAYQAVSPAVEDLWLRQGIAGILAQKAARPAFRHLWDAEVKVFSQWGEDGILDLLLDRLDIARPSCVELGAGNFHECNTRFLAEYRAAQVLAVDGRSDLDASVRRSPIAWRTTVLTAQTWITPDSAPALLNEARASFGTIDVLSLDIDGNDYWVAESIDLLGISVVVVEYNPLFGHTRAVSVPRDDQFTRTQAHHSNLYYGASLRAFTDLMASRGFAFLGSNRAGNNAFFVPRASAHSIGVLVPGTADLSAYVDWRVRESRNPDGHLTYLTGDARIQEIGHLPLVDVHTGRRLTVRDAQGPSTSA